jgi:type IV secretion system protein VirB4
VLLVRRRLDKFVYRDYAFDVTYYDFYLGAKGSKEVFFSAKRVDHIDRPRVKGSAGVKTLALEGGSFARVLHAYSYPESLPEAFLYSLFPLVDEIALIFRSVPKHVAIRMVEGARKRKAPSEEIEQQYAVGMLEELAQSILAGSELFEAHLTFTLIDKDIKALNEREKQVRVQLKSFGIDAEAPPAGLQKSLYSFSTCSWFFCTEKTYADSESLKAMYMLVDEELHDPQGIFLGVSGTGSPVVMDVWSRDNLNFIICGVTGSGKSMTAKVFLKRLTEKVAEEGVEVPIIGVDPESEYTRVAHAFNAVPFEVVEIPGKGLGKPLGLDPIKLIQLKALSVGEVADILSDLYIIPVKYQGLLRKALFVLGDQVKDFQEFVIALDAEAEKRRIPEARALMKYLAGTTAPPDVDVFRGDPPELNGSIIFGLKNVRSKRLKIMIATFISAFAYSKLLTRARKSVFFADEAWLLMELKSTAELIEGLARRGRKHGVAFMFISQSAKDLAQNEHGRILLEQSATILTLRHEPEARDTLKEVLKLTDSEIEYLVQAVAGSGILKAGRKRLTVQVLPTEEELEMFSTTVR